MAGKPRPPLGGFALRTLTHALYVDVPFASAGDPQDPWKQCPEQGSNLHLQPHRVASNPWLLLSLRAIGVPMVRQT